MNNKNIVAYLDHYIKSENANFAILLKGSWGTGKTFFIKNLIESWSRPTKPKDRFISVNPIYISLNGTSSKKEIIEMLKEKITPFIYSKGAKITKEIFKGFAKSTLKIDFDLIGDREKDGSFDLSFDPVSIFKSDNNTIKGNRIIIFDDIERSNIPVDEIYGFINDFIEHSKCKIILISDEDKIIANDEKTESKYPYLSFKEKIIGQTFEIVPNVEEAVDYFISSDVFEIKKYLEDHKKLIIKIFNSSEKRNLRVLQRALFDFDRLFKNTKKKLENDPVKFSLLVKNFLAYFLIYYLEYNTGDSEIVNFQSPFKIEDKKHHYYNYEEVMKSENLYHSTKLFTAAKLMNYITKGNYEELAAEINSSIIYNPSQEKDWEKLWYWKILEDQDFVDIINIVEEEFFTGENLHFTEILHIAGIFFELIDAGLYANKTKIQVTERAKLLISNSKDLEQLTDSSLALRSSWRKSYISISTDEFQALLKFLKLQAKKKLNLKSEKFINAVLSGLNNSNIDNLYETFKTYDDANNSSYEKTSLFKKVKTKQFAELVFNLNNQAASDLEQYFIYRYYPEKTSTNLKIEAFHKDELKFIEGLKKELEKKITQISDKPLKLHMIQNFTKLLENIIIRLQ